MNSPKVQIQIECSNPECTQHFVVEVAAAEVINTLSLSAIVWAHPDVQSCPHCGVAYQMRLLKVESPTIKFDPVRVRSDANIIVPPAGMKLPPAPGSN